MSELPDLPDQDVADIVALADGRMGPERRAAVEARIAGDPVLDTALERQQSAVRAITAAAAAVEAPHDLRVRIDALGSRPPARARRRWLPFAGFAGAAAAVGAALLVALSGSDLSVSQTLIAAIRPPLATASIDPLEPRLLREDVDGVRFPNYAEKFGWTAAGVRTDTIEDRGTRTVFYAKGGVRVAYTIVAGEALPEPEDAGSSTREGVKLRSFTADGRTVVTWRRQGHTCVVSGTGVAVDELLELAAWKGKGAVAF